MTAGGKLSNAEAEIASKFRWIFENEPGALFINPKPGGVSVTYSGRAGLGHLERDFEGGEPIDAMTEAIPYALRHAHEHGLYIVFKLVPAAMP